MYSHTNTGWQTQIVSMTRKHGSPNIMLSEFEEI